MDKQVNSISRFVEKEEVLWSGNTGIEPLLNSIPSSSSSESLPSSESSSSSDESEREESIRCGKLCEVIEGYSDNQFKFHMRLRRSTAEFLIERYQVSIPPKTHSGGKLSVPPRKKVYTFLWYISNTITFRQLSNLFGISISTAWYIVNSVSAWLISIGHEYIKWPKGAFAADVMRKFEEKSGIPGVMGVIDCTHIYIKAPSLNKENYANGQYGYSLVLQGVVDADKRFTDITCGEPGSLRDSKVLRRSNLFNSAQSDRQTLFPNDSYILGDSAYTATSWLVPPFKNNANMTESQRNFNEVLTTTRSVVDDAFGLLKTRFKRLKQFKEQTSLCFIVNIIVSACVLHNICITFDDLDIEIAKDEGLVEHNLPDQKPFEENVQTLGDRRDSLLEYIQQHNLV